MHPPDSHPTALPAAQAPAATPAAQQQQRSRAKTSTAARNLEKRVRRHQRRVSALEAKGASLRCRLARLAVGLENSQGLLRVVATAHEARRGGVQGLTTALQPSPAGGIPVVHTDATADAAAGAGACFHASRPGTVPKHCPGAADGAAGSGSSSGSSSLTGFGTFPSGTALAAAAHAGLAIIGAAPPPPAPPAPLQPVEAAGGLTGPGAPHPLGPAGAAAAAAAAASEATGGGSGDGGTFQVDPRLLRPAWSPAEVSEAAAAAVRSNGAGPASAETALQQHLGSFVQAAARLVL
jgi:hypothetical protein